MEDASLDPEMEILKNRATHAKKTHTYSTNDRKNTHAGPRS